MELDLASLPELAYDESAIFSSRVFRAPRELVYEAFVDPRQVVQWWGPHGFTTTIHEMDVRTGGKWKLTMHGPDGTNYPNTMTFIEVVPYNRIRLGLFGCREGAEPIRLNKTLTWEDAPEGTLMTWRIDFPSREQRDANVREYGSVQGLRDLFERLESLLSAANPCSNEEEVTA
ncbi:Uncharacterized conserved protein YndB, AHSA1/START domain [Bryocella elongata]|uniref:Uncharacterized conserved protein YndB, AHSA1/START domain n=1 Tax=Bryocella elongata TaxID=863522 RepID=A0A1H6BLP6_9BACT|nr:SRPBCC domain-containing protein [Bryocella elongata]SEG61116.1 Uncharacterized conserved protein YndB, AHSA1/START domain [Bryocella elongata]